MLKLISFFLLMLFVFETRADHYITTYQSEKIDSSKPTRILVAGYGDDLHLLFQQVAKAKAQKLKEQYPNDQIVLIAVEQEDSDNETALKNWGFNIVESKSSKLDGKLLIKELSSFKQILSLDIFSHSSAQFGVHLKGMFSQLTTTTRGLETLRGNFVKGAYAVLHGCNTGFYLAPYLSKVWGIPVAGSLTSTNFQRLHSNGHFYLEESGFPPSTDWSKTNAISYNEPLKCKDGYCLRLKPDNMTYVGHWGEYQEGGLPFYKWFCVDGEKETCLKAMAKNLLTQISIVNLKSNSSIQFYKKAVFDFLCPISSKRELRRECEEKLEEALVTKDYTYSPFSRTQLQCDFNKCQAEIKCDTIIFTKIPKPGTCYLINKTTSESTTIVREYLSYLQAFEFLK